MRLYEIDTEKKDRKYSMLASWLSSTFFCLKREKEREENQQDTCKNSLLSNDTRYFLLCILKVLIICITRLQWETKRKIERLSREKWMLWTEVWNHCSIWQIQLWVLVLSKQIFLFSLQFTYFTKVVAPNTWTWYTQYTHSISHRNSIWTISCCCRRNTENSWYANDVRDDNGKPKHTHPLQRNWQLVQIDAYKLDFDVYFSLYLSLSLIL